MMSRVLDQQEAVQALGATPLFAALDASSLASLSEVAVTRRYRRGQFLWYQGDRGDHVFVVTGGLIKVVLTSLQGDEVVLATVGPHETVGELAVLDGLARSASVVAVEPTTVLILDRPTLLHLIASQPTVLDALMRSFGTLVRRLTELTGDLVFLDLGGRMAKLLLRLAEAQPQTSGPPVLDLSLSQSDLAAMVGATRPAVNRVLRVLASRGLISIHGHVIELRDLVGLRRRAGF